MQFRRRALRVLDRIFKFEGAGAPPAEFSPGGISWVADVGRFAALGAIETDRLTGGFLQVGQDNTHAIGGDTVEVNVNPFSALDASWGTVGERWMWLMWQALSASASILTTANVGVNIPAIGNAVAVRFFPLGSWASLVQVHSDTHDFVGFNPRNAGNIDLGDWPSLPFPLFEGCTIGFRSVSSAAGTIRWSSLCWVGPLGVYPPGLL